MNNSNHSIIVQHRHIELLFCCSRSTSILPNLTPIDSLLGSISLRSIFFKMLSIRVVNTYDYMYCTASILTDVLAEHSTNNMPCYLAKRLASSVDTTFLNSELVYLP
jgi:hypothetical protein